MRVAEEMPDEDEDDEGWTREEQEEWEADEEDLD